MDSNKIENDTMIQKIAEYVNVDLSSLKIDDDYERKEIELAHEISGVAYDDIAHFFSRLEIPEFISPRWILKALKFNERFYIQNLALIRATEWMRQEVYEKSKKDDSHTPLSIDFPFGEISIPQEHICLAAAPGDGHYRLPKIFNGGLDTEYEICFAEARPSVTSQNDFEDIEVHLKLKNPENFAVNKCEFHLKTLSPSGKVNYSSEPIKLHPLVDSIFRIYVKDVPKKSLFGHAWTLFYTEEE